MQWCWYFWSRVWLVFLGEHSRSRESNKPLLWWCSVVWGWWTLLVKCCLFWREKETTRYINCEGKIKEITKRKRNIICVPAWSCHVMSVRSQNKKQCRSKKNVQPRNCIFPNQLIVAIFYLDRDKTLFLI